MSGLLSILDPLAPTLGDIQAAIQGLDENSVSVTTDGVITTLGSLGT